MLTPIDIYTDGSFNGKNASWAFVAVQNDSILFKNKGIITDPDVNSGYQIGGEVQAVIEAIKYCEANSLAAKIHYDYAGVENWATLAWRANKPYTIKYQQFMQEKEKFIAGFVKIKSHSGNKWNEWVDKFAKIS